MQPQSTTRRVPSGMANHPASIPITNGQVILDGFGMRISLERGHLHLEDGIGDTRRSATLSRATCNLKRLAIIGHSGNISLDAIRWLSDVGASLSVIDKDGAVLLAHGSRGRDDGKLRRAQAIAPYTGANIPVVRYLLKLKLAGQANTLARFAPDDHAISAIEACSTALDTADTCEALRAYEANAANAYWEALASVPIRFGKRDVVPEHWRTFGTRSSAITGNPRKASNPVNAMLNYAYAILEAEASIAIQAVGLDPAMGVLHADMPSRDSLSCDVMEALRPKVDDFILDLLASRTFAANQFHETREGVCRILPPLTETLVGTAHVWVRLLGPVVEHVAQAFMNASVPAFGSLGTSRVTQASRSASLAKPKTATPKQEELPTILTQSKRSEGRDGVRKQPKREAPVVVASTLVGASCRACGTLLPDARRSYCDACFPEREAEVLAAWNEAGPKALAGKNHGGEIGEKRGKTNAAHHAAIQAWEAEHGTDYDASEFTTRILPMIRDVPVRRLVEATGLSLMYCSLIRRGGRIPHPIHWEAFANVSIDKPICVHE